MPYFHVPQQIMHPPAQLTTNALRYSSPTPQVGRDRLVDGATDHHADHHDDQDDASLRAHRIRVKNRRKRYLDMHPEYFDSGLELADPLLYDRLIRRFQTPAEREAEGRAKGYSGVLEADLLRSEAKMQALRHPDPNVTISYKRGRNGEIVAEERDEVPASKEEGMKRWRDDMGQRFLRGEDKDFDYAEVDESEEWDDRQLEEREKQEVYFDAETPTWIVDEGGAEKGPSCETGLQDF